MMLTNKRSTKDISRSKEFSTRKKNFYLIEFHYFKMHRSHVLVHYYFTRQRIQCFIPTLPSAHTDSGTLCIGQCGRFFNIMGIYINPHVAYQRYNKTQLQFVILIIQF